MLKDQIIRRIKLFVSVLALAAMCWQAAGVDSAGQTRTDRPEFAGIGSSMTERLGADDGPSLVLHFSGDIHGSLEPCG